MVMTSLRAGRMRTLHESSQVKFASRQARPASERERVRKLQPFESQSETERHNAQRATTKRIYTRINPSEIGNIKYVFVFVFGQVMVT